MGIVTVRWGSTSSFTFTVTLLPSATVYARRSKLTVTFGTPMKTVVLFLLPALKPAGRVPKASLTLSPLSSTSSMAAVKVNVPTPSPAAMVTSRGTV